MDSALLYRRLAAHYVHAIQTGSLAAGDCMPSLRALMRLHHVSLSTALQTCRYLETEGWLEARPRSGYFVLNQRVQIAPLKEPDASVLPDPAQYVGIHEKVSDFFVQSQQYPIRLNLAGARAAPGFYPVEQLKNAAIRTLRRQPELLVNSGSNQGNAQFKTVLAKRALARGLAIAPQDILVTHGASEALTLALRAVAEPGDTVAVESPTYYGLLQILESLGMRALEITTSPRTGISLEALQLALQTYAGIKAVVVMPHLQNPLCSIMPDEHKARLVELCELHRIALIEDDVCGELIDRDTPPTAIKSLDSTGSVIYCASLTKTLAPGMRLGWMLAGRWHARVEMLKRAQLRENDEWPQLAAAEVMASSAYDRHLRRLWDALRTQRRRYAAAIDAYFPPGTRLTVPDGGGAMLWIELPHERSSQRVFEQALREGILIAPGTIFSNSGRFDHFIRLNCGAPYSQEIDRALFRLGQIADAP